VISYARAVKWPLLLAALAACPKGGDKPKPVEPTKRDDAQSRLLPEIDGGPIVLAPAPALPAVPAGLPPAPANPRVTPDALALGELLFYEPRLSQSGSRACSNCHDPETGYSGNVQLAADGKQNLRRTPALVNLAWAKAFGWDGRYATFADHLPSHLKGQLGDPIDVVTTRLDAVPLYHAHFARIGGAPQDAVIQALEAYVLTRYEGGSAWDAMERTALTKSGTTSSDPIVAGYQLFIGKAQCGVCHPPPLYSDHAFHKVAANPLNDPGNKGAFKTPTLRGASARTSFFHAGHVKGLEDAVATYQKPIADGDPILAKVRLSPDETKQVVAFLQALTADRPAPSKPVLP
jgi:cytochrome c peroxidase